MVRRQRHRLHLLPLVLLDQVVGEYVPSLDHRRRRGVFAGVALPYQHLLHLDTRVLRDLHRLVRLDLVVEERTRTMVGVGGNQDRTAGVDDPVAARRPAEPSEYLRVDHSQTRAGQHRDRQLDDHRHVERHAVARLQPQALQQRSRLVDPDVQFLKGENDVRLVFELRNPDESRLVGVLFQVPVDAVVAGVQPPPDEPVEERRVGIVQRRMPVLVPRQEVGVLDETVRKLVRREAVEYPRIGQIRLSDERRARVDHLLFLPVGGDLGFGDVAFGRHLSFDSLQLSSFRRSGRLIMYHKRTGEGE